MHIHQVFDIGTFCLAILNEILPSFDSYISDNLGYNDICRPAQIFSFKQHVDYEKLEFRMPVTSLSFAVLSLLYHESKRQCKTV